MQFETWLKKQKLRQDPVGDLARDYIESTNMTGLREKLTHETLPYYASTDVHDALEKALYEYFICLSENLINILGDRRTYINESLRSLCDETDTQLRNFLKKIREKINDSNNSEHE